MFTLILGFWDFPYIFSIFPYIEGGDSSKQSNSAVGVMVRSGLERLQGADTSELRDWRSIRGMTLTHVAAANSCVMAIVGVAALIYPPTYLNI